MANVAFDKYVEFCETYKDAAGEAIATLTRLGPTKDVLREAHKLYAIRFKFCLWIPADRDEHLHQFEQALMRIGAYSGFIESTRATAGNQEARQRHIDLVYREFAKVVGLKQWEGEKLSEEFTINAIIGGLREVLGTERIGRLRLAVLDRAVKELD